MDEAWGLNLIFNNSNIVHQTLEDIRRSASTPHCSYQQSRQHHLLHPVRGEVVGNHIGAWLRYRRNTKKEQIIPRTCIGCRHLNLQFRVPHLEQAFLIRVLKLTKPEYAIVTGAQPNPHHLGLDLRGRVVTAILGVLADAPSKADF